MDAKTDSYPVSTWMLAGCGAWLIGLGLYFAFLRQPLLPEDTHFMGTTLANIRSDLPGLESWLKNVFTVMGGFMAGAGVLTAFVSLTAKRLRPRGAAWTIAISGALTVVLMSAANFSLGSDFKWVLLIPALVWIAALAAHIAEH